jgi:hypothetical protein
MSKRDEIKKKAEITASLKRNYLQKLNDKYSFKKVYIIKNDMPVLNKWKIVSTF